MVGEWMGGGVGGRVSLDLRRLIGIPLRASGAYEAKKKKGWISQEGVLD